MSLSDLIRKSVAKDNYRVLLRRYDDVIIVMTLCTHQCLTVRTDSVAERILSNWLALCLHQHILVCMSIFVWHGITK